jgi:hypothetical protein
MRRDTNAERASHSSAEKSSDNRFSHPTQSRAIQRWIAFRSVDVEMSSEYQLISQLHQKDFMNSLESACGGSHVETAEIKVRASTDLFIASSGAEA